MRLLVLPKPGFTCYHPMLFISLLSGKTMLAGNNVGYVTLMCLDSGEQLWQKKLHKGKVSHIGFSPREPWMFVTASIDHLVKVE